MLAAADGYSYLHLIIVAGIIIYAGGVKLVVHNSASAPMPTTGRLALCGGVAVYMLGLAAFRRRMGGELDVGRIALAATLIVLFAVGGSISAWTVAAGLAALTVALCAAEGFTARAAAD